MESSHQALIRIHAEMAAELVAMTAAINNLFNDGPSWPVVGSAAKVLSDVKNINEFLGVKK